jgi:type II secretory pathway component PulF
MSTTIRILRLLLLAATIVVVCIAAYLITISCERNGDAVALVLVVALSVALVGIACWAIVSQFVGRRQAEAVLNYLEQAVRLNLPLPRIVGAIAESQPGRLGRNLRLAKEKLEQGESLTTVLQIIPQTPPRVIGLVAAAERSGRLPQVLARLLEQRRASRSSALSVDPFYRTYALILSIAIVTVVSMLMIFVIPKYEQIFKDFHTDLPWMTQVTIGVSRVFAEQPWLMALLILVLVALVLNSALTRWRGGAYGVVESPVGRFISYLPWLGQIRTYRAMGDAFQCAADAIENGRPIEQSLLESAHICGNARVRQKIEYWVNQMSRGRSLPDAARDAQMPELVTGMLATAVHTPDVPQVLEFLGRYYSGRFSRSLELLRAAVVPMIALTFGFVVGWIALSIFAPLISLIHTVSYPVSGGL